MAGASRAEIAFVIERIAGILAKETGREPVQITGYRQLNADEVALINTIKAKGNELGDLVSLLKQNTALDQRWVSIGQTDLQRGLMALVRAVAKPEFF